MGYYSVMDACLEFDSEEARLEYETLPEEVVSRFGNPFWQNMDLDTYEDKPLNIEFSETFVKMGEYDEWIPWIAHFIRGEMSVYGDEIGDYWRVDFIGNGKYICYHGDIQYHEVDLKDL